MQLGRDHDPAGLGASSPALCWRVAAWSKRVQAYFKALSSFDGAYGTWNACI